MECAHSDVLKIHAKNEYQNMPVLFHATAVPLFAALPPGLASVNQSSIIVKTLSFSLRETLLQRIESLFRSAGLLRARLRLYARTSVLQLSNMVRPASSKAKASSSNGTSANGTSATVNGHGSSVPETSSVKASSKRKKRDSGHGPASSEDEDEPPKQRKSMSL